MIGSRLKLSTQTATSSSNNAEKEAEYEEENAAPESSSKSSLPPISISRNSSQFLGVTGIGWKPKGFSNFFQRGTLTPGKKKCRDPHFQAGNAPNLSCRNRSRSKSCLLPPMPPMAPSNQLRRVNSSTLSLTTSKRKILTLEDLYVEILYTILHMIGCDADRDEQTQLILHLKEAFKMEMDKHKLLLDTATMREEPYLKLNLDILEAKDLLGKDISGSSDPFCTFYLTTNPLTRYNTNYKAKTLNPIWAEEFVMDVNSIENDVLCIDVWDFNPEENVSDKLKKINEIRGGRGLRKFIKETLNASTGKTTHDLLGSVEIPLRV